MQASEEEEKLNPGHEFNSETELSSTRIKNVKTEQNGETEHLGYDDDDEDDDVAEDEEEDDEFSFFCGETNTSPIAAEDAFVNGQIKPVFPLFDRDLQFSGDGSISLPMRPPVKKVFVETTEEDINGGGMTSSSAGDDVIVGPYCEWSSRKAVEAASPAAAEACKKSNSTGFSRIWRFKEFVGRCNSDGRDAFVFLNNAPPRAAAPAVAEKSEKPESTVKVNSRKGKKGTKTAPLSAHEAYMRSKAKEEERRRSYLPYRPELMGFFTNVNGGLTKNVHPF